MARMTTCPACGATSSGGARFCASCGRPLRGVDDERRVVTVLFADLVGFTTLSERLDPERVKNLVDRCFDRLAVDVTTFGGQIDKIVGDALVALFGAPIAHEDDAERAVRAALRMHETLREEAEALGVDLRMRVGVNTGEVLVGAMHAAGSVTAMGDVVNTASRLQTSAAPGEVLVGPATHAATHTTIAYEPRGLLAAKGREATVDTWKAVAPTLPPGYRARRVDVPLVGRDSEVGLLKQAVDMSIRQERVLVVVLVGDVGMGKSRLSDDIASWTMAEHGTVVREGRCLPYGEANVWWPVAEALRAGMGLAEGQGHEAAQEAVRGQVATAMGRRTTDAEVQRTADGLLSLMGYDPPSGADPATVREEAGRALAAYANASTSLRPLLLQLSDLHWADDALLELLDDVFSTVNHRPLVVVATARPALLDRWSPRPGRQNSLVLHLDPLGRESAAELLDVLVGSPVPASVAEALLDRSGGNPFFLEELVTMLDGDAALASSRVAALPDTLRGLVATRLDDLSPDARCILQDASVIGPRGPVAGLRAMAREIGRDIDVDAAVADLVADEIMEVEGGNWAFRSDLIREVAYQMITKAERAKRHLGTARYIEAWTNDHEQRPPWLVDQLAHHYGTAVALAAELGPSDRILAFPPDLADQARRWVVEAADRARRDQALPTAIRLYGQALDLLGRSPTERGVPTSTADPLPPPVQQLSMADSDERNAEASRLYLARAKVAAEAWDLVTARHDVDAACALADRLDDAGAAARALVVRGDVEHKEGHVDQAVATLTQAAQRFADLGDDGGRGAALRHRGLVEIFDGRVIEAEASALEALTAFERADDKAGRGWTSQNLAWTAFVTGRTEEADARLSAAIDLFSDVVDTRGLAWSLGLLAWVRFQQGRVAEASALADRVLEEAEARNDPWAAAMTRLLIGSIRLWDGRTAEGVELAGRARHAFAVINDGYGLGTASAVLGRALVMAGRVDEGFDLMVEATTGGPEGRALRDAGEPLGQFVLLSTAVQIGELQRAGDIPDADVLIGAMGDQAKVPFGLAALQLGDVGTATRYLDGPDEGVAGASQLAARALLAACTGHGSAAELADRVNSADGATYLDRALAEVAAGLEALSGSDGGAVASRHVAAAQALVDATDDRTGQAVVALAAATVAHRIGSPDVDADANAADEHAEHLLVKAGITAEGWSRLFDLTLHPVTA